MRTTPRRSRTRRLLREARSVPTLLAVFLTLLVGLPLAVLLTPDQRITVLGQSLAVGGRDPGLSWSGPAQVVQVGNTRLDLPALNVAGFVRPRLSLGPIVRGEEAARALDPTASADAQAEALRSVVHAFVRWFAWGGLGVIVAATVISALVGSLRVLLFLHRQGRLADSVPVHELRHRLSGAAGRTTVVTVVVGLLAWGACGFSAYRGTVDGIAATTSLSDLVGSARPPTPEPVGPPIRGFPTVVIGDSRAARVGGPPVPDATAQDTACGRSSDSLAEELSLLRSEPVLNLACSGASISAGLRGPQVTAGVGVDPQVGRLRKVEGLQRVVVAIGPNDLAWSDFLQYCYGLQRCDDRLTKGEFDYRLAAFDADWAALLEDLAGLPGHPQVVVVASYDAFAPGAGSDCPDVRGPNGFPGLDSGKIALLAGRNAQLNAVLAAGAAAYDDPVVRPSLTLLCGKTVDGLGPDLQGLNDGHPFHPTAVGSLRNAAAVEAAMR